MNSALGSFLGSAVYTPSTLVALRSTFASISSARSTAAVSVEKYGFPVPPAKMTMRDRKSTRLNSSHGYISYAVFCLKKKKKIKKKTNHCTIKIEQRLRVQLR